MFREELMADPSDSTFEITLIFSTSKWNLRLVQLPNMLLAFVLGQQREMYA